jgi:hypothetical protein
MNTTRFLLLIGMLVSLSLQAKKVEGKIVFANETLDVVFNIPINILEDAPNYEKIQLKVKYYDASGEKWTLRPEDAQEIQFTYGQEHVRMISVSNAIGLGGAFVSSPKIFLKLEIDGHLKLFAYFYTQSTPGMANPATGIMTGGYSFRLDRYILQKGEGQLKKVKSASFKRDISEYLSDCPMLVQKIENKEFKKDDIESVVRFYNADCQEH